MYTTIADHKYSSLFILSYAIYHVCVLLQTTPTILHSSFFNMQSHKVPSYTIIANHQDSSFFIIQMKFALCPILIGTCQVPLVNSSFFNRQSHRVQIYNSIADPQDSSLFIIQVGLAVDPILIGTQVPLHFTSMCNCHLGRPQTSIVCLGTPTIQFIQF